MTSQSREDHTGVSAKPLPARPASSPDASHGAWPSGVTPTNEFLAAHDYLREGKGHLFVTGRAGTGKSTLLKCLRDLIPAEMVIVAPTGLAAVNVGGQTIHSFFGLPPRLIRKDDIRRSRNGRIMRGLKYLVIDEVSMVRSDIMWAVDQSLRVNRGRAREPFGGVRLAMFGDLHQLPPVIDEGEVAAHLETEHGGPFFFDVGALREGHGTALIELSEVFRQRDEALLGVLNKVRDGEADEDDLAILNERVHPIRTLSEGEPYVILTPTNAAAKRINTAYLEALAGRPHAYQAGVTGEFNESAQPTDCLLVLKPGAKVMLLRNDPDRRWVNGTIARVARVEPGKVWVEVDGDEHEIERASWENRRYAYDKDAETIVETVAGTFKQFPLRLAWALTIHKSQGLTLDKVYIDLGRGTFAHGQAYVGLSRCRTLEGLALARALRPSDILFDPAVMGYRRLFEPLG
jgi:ATP-dependent exoDNAse (exonuclease V) alpha subunit